jgi:TRAP-type C4-dicarboxylate transport system permease large subunit
VAPDVPLPTILRGSMPYVFIMLAFMVALSFFPQIATWLPDLLMGKGH